MNFTTNARYKCNQHRQCVIMAKLSNAGWTIMPGDRKGHIGVTRTKFDVEPNMSVVRAKRLLQCFNDLENDSVSIIDSYFKENIK